MTQKRCFSRKNGVFAIPARTFKAGFRQNRSKVAKMATFDLKNGHFWSQQGALLRVLARRWPKRQKCRQSRHFWHFWPPARRLRRVLSQNGQNGRKPPEMPPPPPHPGGGGGGFGISGILAILAVFGHFRPVLAHTSARTSKNRENG